MSAFVERIAPGGAMNGLAQTAVRLMAPGVPDTYQGTELWDLSLVDPDNRGPVDFGTRLRLLETAAGAPSLDAWRSGAPKLALIAALLGLRARMPALFASGDYVPLAVRGERKNNVLAFARVYGNACVVVAVPRCVGALCDGVPNVPGPFWGDTHIVFDRQAAWMPVVGGCAFSGRRLACADAFARFPVLVLSAGV
jgi:(1->4)-alpha-D-glucan 1-alpha-D-glucosylmutase